MSFDARRGARENLKLFSVLMLSSPGERAIRRRLTGELRNVVTTHVPASVPVARGVSCSARPRARGSLIPRHYERPLQIPQLAAGLPGSGV